MQALFLVVFLALLANAAALAYGPKFGVKSSVSSTPTKSAPAAAKKSSPLSFGAKKSSAPSFGAKKSSVPSFGAKKSSGPQLVSKIDKKFGKDMTWGGRPDAAPEMLVEGASIPFTSPGYRPMVNTADGGFFEAAWRYNRR